jgi:hypothetical protein
MNNTNTGGPAFPTTVRDHYDPETGGQWSEYVDPGMSLRDYFAAKAMQGYCTDPVMTSAESVATLAYQIADAMLRAREQ